MTVSMSTTAVCSHHTAKHAAWLVPWVLSPLAQTPSQRIAAILAIHGLSELVVASRSPNTEVIANRCHPEELLVVRTCQLFHRSHSWLELFPGYASKLGYFLGILCLNTRLGLYLRQRLTYGCFIYILLILDGLTSLCQCRPDKQEDQCMLLVKSKSHFLPFLSYFCFSKL